MNKIITIIILRKDPKVVRMSSLKIKKRDLLQSLLKKAINKSDSENDDWLKAKPVRSVGGNYN